MTFHIKSLLCKTFDVQVQEHNTTYLNFDVNSFEKYYFSSRYIISRKLKVIITSLFQEVKNTVKHVCFEQIYFTIQDIIIICLFKIKNITPACIVLILISFNSLGEITDHAKNSTSHKD